jgi:hypothetical protein
MCPENGVHYKKETINVDNELRCRTVCTESKKPRRGSGIPPSPLRGEKETINVDDELRYGTVCVERKKPCRGSALNPPKH